MRAIVDFAVVRIAEALILGGLLCLAVIVGEVRSAEPGFTPEDVEFFEKRVRPVLVQRCYECHSQQTGKQRGGLTLDDRDAILTGGDSGPAVVPREVDKSLLVEAVRYSADGQQMPPTGKLPQAEIDLLVEWVARGLPHPTPTQTHTARKGIDFAAGRRHWAFQPLVEQSVPQIEAAPRDFQRIDYFLEAKRIEHGLTPSAPADSRTLARRATYDLLGLPPEVEELSHFGNQISPSPSLPLSLSNAEGVSGRGGEGEKTYLAYLYKLLASPHYGERWGRYWLDLARYADVTESWREGDGQPWRYRDWVVKAFNDDLPYDEFVRRQIAADLLSNTKPEDNAALGLLGLSPSYWKELKLDHQVIKMVVAEEWEERLDMLGATFLGLTIGCARCHDHKFDPISAHDYYALAGVLASVRESDRPLISAELAGPALSARHKVKMLDQKLKPLAAKKMPSDVEQTEIAKLQAGIAQLKETPNYDLPLACGVTDAALHVLPSGQNATRLEYRAGESQDLAMHVRGNPARTGIVVPRRFLAVLAADPQRTFKQGSGRLELAESLVADAGPLTARVIVNRVWKHHFGRGIVETPSNFGLQGAAPTHRELLDDLAARFVSNGWSLKWLHREIMSSAAYRQSSYREPAKHAIDPENQWLWRMTPRRLDVESWRDAMLAATGTLDETIGGPPIELTKLDNRRRTIYGLVRRREISELLRLYDFPDPVAHSAQREPTTTPLQQLFVLNSPFFAQQTRTLVERMQHETSAASAERIGWLYRTLFQRAVSAEERKVGEQFVVETISQGSKPDEVWRQYLQVLLASNEFLFVD